MKETLGNLGGTLRTGGISGSRQADCPGGSETYFSYMRYLHISVSTQLRYAPSVLEKDADLCTRGTAQNRGGLAD